jgi:hypothetical protein
MKVNLIGMILNNAGRQCFDCMIKDGAGKELGAADSLHFMIMEYAKVIGGGTSDTVTASREVQAGAVFARSADTDRLERFERWLADRAGPLLHIDAVREALE